MPGVLMIEAGAQLASFYTRKFVGWKGFIGFGGADEIRFRQPVVPGSRLYIVGQKMWERHHRIQCKIQGLVAGSIGPGTKLPTLGHTTYRALREAYEQVQNMTLGR